MDSVLEVYYDMLEAAALLNGVIAPEDTEFDVIF